MSALITSITRSAIGLGLFAVITGGTIALTQAMTKERIQEQAAKAEASALFEIIPESEHTNDMLRDTVSLPDSGILAQSGPVQAWVARRNGEPVGMILPAIAPDGYSGNINLLVGIDLQGTILGVRITNHRETPGLGDRIEARKSDWIEAFEGKSLGNPAPQQWNVKKNGGAFDQFTGATITPRAVVKSVQKTLKYFRQNRKTILARIHTPPSLETRAVTPQDNASESRPEEQH